MSGSFKDYYFVSIHRYGTNIEHKHVSNPEPLCCFVAWLYSQSRSNQGSVKIYKMFYIDTLFFIFYTFGFPLALQCCESLLLISVLRDQIMITLSRLLSPRLATLGNSPVMTISSLMHANTRTKGEKTMNSVLFLDKKVHFCQL